MPVVSKLPRKMFHSQWGKAFVKIRDCTKIQSYATRSSMNDPKKVFVAERPRTRLGRVSKVDEKERGMNGRGKKFINDDRPRFSRNWTAAAFHRPLPPPTTEKLIFPGDVLSSSVSSGTLHSRDLFPRICLAARSSKFFHHRLATTLFPGIKSRTRTPAITTGTPETFAVNEVDRLFFLLWHPRGRSIPNSRINHFEWSFWHFTLRWALTILFRILLDTFAL